MVCSNSVSFSHHFFDITTFTVYATACTGKGVGSSLKLEEQKIGLLWRVREREPIRGGARSGSPGGTAPGGGSGGFADPG